MLAVIALAVPLALNLRARVTAEVKTQAQAQADLVAATAADLLALRDRPELTTLARSAAVAVRGRVLIVDGSGRVLVDSDGPSALGTSYNSRPEIRSALQGRQVQVQRASKTLDQNILATAVPIVHRGRAVGAVRVTESMNAVGGAIRRSELGLLLIGAIVLALGLFAGAVIAAQVARPIRHLEQVARRVADGDLQARAGLEGSREQRSLARSFNEMTSRIALLLDAQRQFVADASHQLRTPLTGLRLRLEESRSLAESPEARHEIDAGLAEIDRLTHTVDELLSLSRAGERQVNCSDVDLAEVMRAAVERWRGPVSAREGSIVPRVTGVARAYTARADLDRALDILLENAVGYSSGPPAIEVWASPGSIEVRDRGAGLAPGEHETAFGRFHRGRAGLQAPAGSGLGLTIARELLRASDGEVTLAPRPGGGTIATIALPQLEEAEAALPVINPSVGRVALP